jgi:hypothetical protein
MTLRSGLNFAIVLLLASLRAAGQSAADPADLQEHTIVKLSSTFTTSGPWRCDQRGVLYTRELAPTISSAKLFRISPDGSADPNFSTDALARNFFVQDYAPDNNGEIVAVGFGLVKPYGSRVLRLRSDGFVARAIPLVGPPSFVPLRVAVFTDSALLVAGTFQSPSQPNKDNLSWFTGVFRSDGSLVKEIAFDLTSLSTDSDDPTSLLTGEVAMPYKEWQPLATSLSINSSANNHVIITLPGSTSLPSFGHNTSYLDVLSDGSFVEEPLPGPAASELFATAVVPRGLLAIWGNRRGTIDDLRRYNLDGPLNVSDSSIRRRVLGLPLCSENDTLVVLRPDGKGGLSLVKYRLP